MEFRHPLTADEIEIYNRFSRTWGTGDVGWYSAKIEPLSEELQCRIIGLGEIFGLSVKFYKEGTQNFIHAVRK